VSPALTRGLKKAARSILQLVAGGALTALVAALAHGLSPDVEAVVMAAWTVLVALLQNTAETKGIIPVVLPTAGLVTTTAGGAVTSAVGTADTVVQAGGQVVADVVSTAGKVVGGIAGPVGDLGAGTGL
jgi:polysaccharide pyruvyl transferase WcaK-like protein